MNKEFERFIDQTEKLMTASEKYISGAEKELNEFVMVILLAIVN